MLIEFSVRNYRSIREELKLSLQAAPDKSLEMNVIKNAGAAEKISGRDLLKSIAVFGSNGSGKSTLIDALAFMQMVVLRSARMPDRDVDIPTVPFAFDASMHDKTSDFEVEFLQEGIRYIYGFSVDKNFVHEEWFYGYPKGQRRTYFERKAGNHFNMPSWEGEAKKLIEMTRPNALFASVAAQFNNLLGSIVYSWFRDTLAPITRPHKISESNDLYEYTLKEILNNPSVASFVADALRGIDVGITDILIEQSAASDDIVGHFQKERAKAKEQGPEYVSFYNSVIKVLEKELPNQNVVKAQTTHKGCDSAGNEVEYLLNLKNESDGTKKLFNLLAPLHNVIKNGWVMVVDELDVQMHPFLTRWLVNWFNNPKTNPKNAQLIFSAHDVTLMDKELFRRDQIVLLQRGQFGETMLTTLWDLGERKDRDMERRYLLGAFGALPELYKV